MARTNSDIVTKKEQKLLRARLTEDERNQAGRDLGEALLRRQRVLDEFETVKSHHKTAMQVVDTEIERFAELVNTGESERLVECDLVYDYTTATVTIVRTDTGAHERPPRAMTMEERQRSFLD
jgi:hypothetical protein